MQITMKNPFFCTLEVIYARVQLCETGLGLDFDLTIGSPKDPNMPKIMPRV